MKSILMRAGALVCVAVLLGGCSLQRALEDRGRIDYKSAGKAPPLDVPPDLASPRGDGRFALPENLNTARTASEFERSRTQSRASGDAIVLPAAGGGVQMVRADGERYLISPMSPDQLWPLLREFWQEAGFLIQSESPQTGIIETDWAENRAKIPQDFIRRSLGRVFDSLYSTGERDKFRTRLDRGAQGTEVHITHRGMIEVYSTTDKDQTVWQPRPSDPELEIEFLRRLMVKLGATLEGADQAVAAAGGSPQAGSGNVRTVSIDGVRAIEITDDFERAWRQLGLALDRGGFSVDDRDRSQGLYFVRYIDPEAQARQANTRPGFLSRVFRRQKAEEISRQFRIKAEPGASGVTVVSVLDAEGRVPTGIDSVTATRILDLLEEQLHRPG